MTMIPRALFPVALLAALLAFSTSPLWAGPKAEEDPDANTPPKNLKVLPKEMTRAEVKTLMKQVSKSLGVKCAYCHNTTDWASDEKKKKDVARHFMKMTLEMQEKFFTYEKAPNVKFACYMCHQGKEEPQLTPP